MVRRVRKPFIDPDYRHTPSRAPEAAGNRGGVPLQDPPIPPGAPAPEPDNAPGTAPVVLVNNDAGKIAEFVTKNPVIVVAALNNATRPAQIPAPMLPPPVNLQTAPAPKVAAQKPVATGKPLKPKAAKVKNANRAGKQSPKAGAPK